MVGAANTELDGGGAAGTQHGLVHPEGNTSLCTPGGTCGYQGLGPHKSLFSAEGLSRAGRTCGAVPPSSVLTPHATVHLRPRLPLLPILLGQVGLHVEEDVLPFLDVCTHLLDQLGLLRTCMALVPLELQPQVLETLLLFVD